MSFFCIENLGKFMGKLITHILFLAALELNIIHRERKKQNAIRVG
jgi:hypothetical protein